MLRRYVFLWIGLSACVILYNKWVLAFYGKPAKGRWGPRHALNSFKGGAQRGPPPPTPLPPQRRRPAAGFPYPVALTMWHMFFCAALAFVIIKLGYVEPVTMSVDTCEQRGGGLGRGWESRFAC